MKKLVAAAALALSFAVPATALACEGNTQQAQHAVKKVSVQQLAQMKQTPKTVVLDANGAEFRAKNGVIPGARLLTSSAAYDPSRELPATKDSKLVFYCASEMCSASHKAAERALSAGFQDVSVLPDGLMGWKKAGQPTDVPRS